MTNLPKELKEICITLAKEALEYQIIENGGLPIENNHKQYRYYVGHVDGFEACYQAMLKTHVPRDKVDKLVEASRNLALHSYSIHRQDSIEKFEINKRKVLEILKEFGSGNE